MNLTPLSPLVGFDLETTGLDVEHDRIVQLAVIADPGRDRLSTLVNPGIDIPAAAEAVHGISTARATAEGLPPFAAILTACHTLTRLTQPPANCALVGMNIAFDLTLFDRECQRNNLTPPDVNKTVVFDVLVIDRAMDPNRRGSRRLAALARHYAVPASAAHDAAGDVETTIRVARAQLYRHPTLATMTGDELMRFQVEAQAQWAVASERYLHKSGDPDAHIEGRWPIVPDPTRSRER